MVGNSARSDEEKEELSNEILDELDFCMNELSDFQKHPSMKSMASEKVRIILYD
jgi:Phosphodiesterase 4 upstream conserved regions (UCR)